MTRHDDRSPDMVTGIRIDAAIDQALHDATVTDDVAPFAGFVDDLRVMADRPAPRPSAELAALLAGHRAAEPGTHATVATLRPRRPHRLQPRATRRRSSRSPAAALRMRIAALGLAGKGAMVAVFATTAVAGAAAGILPEPATHFLQRAVEVVTPFELPATGQGARREDHPEATAAEKPGHAGPAAGQHPAPTVHRPDVAGTPTLDGEPLADATTLARPSSAMGNAVTRHVEPGVPGPRGRPQTPLPTAPHPSADPVSVQSPDHEPPGHIPPGHAPPGAPHPGGGHSDDAPLVDVGSDPAPPSASKGPPPKAESPGGPPSGHGRQGPHDGRPGGPGPIQEPRGQAPSNVPGRAQRPGPSPGGEGDRATEGHPGHDPAPPADGRRGVPHRRGPRVTAGEAPHHSDGRSGKNTGSAPAAGVPSSSTPLPTA